MKSTIYILISMLLFAFQPIMAQEIALSVCALPSGEYQFGFTGQVDSWGFTNASSYDLDAMIASGEGVAFTVWYGGTSETIYGYPDVPPCQQDVWQPDAPSISIILTSDCAFIEIVDAWGNYHRVTDRLHPDGIVLHYGELLIGGQQQSTDPTDYRAIETECFE